jgi:hypothetical protein
MNNIVKIQIPISEFYEIINSANVLKAQQLCSAELIISDANTYERATEIMKSINEAIKVVEAARKNVTAPLDSFKSNLINIEKEALAALKQYVITGKEKMLAYSNEVERKRLETEAKLKAEAEASLKNAVAFADIMSTFTDKLYATSVTSDHTKNVRTVTKAKVIGDVDWNMVISLQFANGNLNVEDLLKGLPKAMKTMNIDSIQGIELYEHKTQVIK